MRSIRLLAAAAVLLITLAAPAAAQTPPLAEAAAVTETVRGRADSEHRMTVPVRIGANGPYDFVIDTGSQATVVSANIAGRLALPAAGIARIVDMAGRTDVPTVKVASITLGNRSFAAITAPMLEDENIGADGILGTDSLQHQRVLLDFTRNFMAIGDARTLGGNSGFEIVVTARRKLGQLIMTNAVIDGVHTEVVLDTGSNTSVGNRALQRALERRSSMQRITLVTVTGKEVTADLGVARRLDIAEVGISNIVIAFADSPVFGALELERRPAMMLGMRELRLFRRVAIDFATRKVYFDLPRVR
jgi:predicted aspartyl protease